MSPVDATGRWEEFGTGLVGVYKEDWDRFHGMVVFSVLLFFPRFSLGFSLRSVTPLTGIAQKFNLLKIVPFFFFHVYAN